MPCLCILIGYVLKPVSACCRYVLTTLCHVSQNFTWEHRFFHLGIMMPPDRMHQTDSGTSKQLMQNTLALLQYYYHGMALSKKLVEFDRS